MLIALWIILIILLAWLALTELPAGRDGHNPLPFLIALTPMLWIGFTGLGIIGAFMREWSFVVCCIIGLIASLLRKTSYYVNDLSTPNTAAAIARHYSAREHSAEKSAAIPHDLHTEFRVLTCNCRFGHAQASEIIELVKQEHVSVLALQELTEDLVDELDQLGIVQFLPYRQLGDSHANDNGGFNGLWMSEKPDHSISTGVPIPAADVPTATLKISPTRTLVLASAHPKSPQRSCPDWSAGIIGLGALAHPQAPEITTQDVSHNPDHNTITVVMGDLNSSIAHPSFRALLGSGFHDAALFEAKGQHPTWPSWLHWPRLVLDHILFTNYMSAHDVQSIFMKGSDHLALAATLKLETKYEPMNAAAQEHWPDSIPPLPHRSRQTAPHAQSAPSNTDDAATSASSEPVAPTPSADEA